jgi:hypothetical protein
MNKCEPIISLLNTVFFNFEGFRFLQVISLSFMLSNLKIVFCLIFFFLFIVVRIYSVKAVTDKVVFYSL